MHHRQEPYGHKNTASVHCCTPCSLHTLQDPSNIKGRSETGPAQLQPISTLPKLQHRQEHSAKWGSCVTPSYASKIFKAHCCLLVSAQITNHCSAKKRPCTSGKKLRTRKHQRASQDVDNNLGSSSTMRLAKKGARS